MIKINYWHIDEINKLKISDNIAGFYILFKLKTEIKTKVLLRPYYVGRSDPNLRGRIKASAGERVCKYFYYETVSSPRAAYLKECEYYHKYEEILVNEIHPDVPDGANWRCPVKGCDWGY